METSKRQERLHFLRDIAIVGAATLIGALLFWIAAPGLVHNLANRPNFDGNALGSVEPVVRLAVPVLGAGVGVFVGAMIAGSLPKA